MSFNTRTPVKDLYGDYVSEKPINLPDRWDESTGDYAYEFWDAQRCEECGKIVVGTGGEDRHCDLDDESECDGYIYSEGPMMNYAYAVDVQHVGGVEEAARAIVDLPLCIVEMDGDHYLALTGGGMDLSWEICEAYMRLGHLPPTHFSDLPSFGGDKLSARRRWVLAGMRRAIKLQMNWLQSDLTRLALVSKHLRTQA